MSILKIKLVAQSLELDLRDFGQIKSNETNVKSVRNERQETVSGETITSERKPRTSMREAWEPLYKIIIGGAHGYVFGSPINYEAMDAGLRLTEL